MISPFFFTDPPRCTPVKPRTNPPLAAQCSPASDRRLGRFADRHWGVSWPPVGTFVTAYGENLMTADRPGRGARPGKSVPGGDWIAHNGPATSRDPSARVHRNLVDRALRDRGGRRLCPRD